MFVYPTIKEPESKTKGNSAHYEGGTDDDDDHYKPYTAKNVWEKA